MVWTIEEALKLVRALQPETRQFGYHLALGGGVLNNGRSDKDLDLYFLPLNNTKFPEDQAALLAWLSKMWGAGQTLGDYGMRNEDDAPVDGNGNILGVPAVGRARMPALPRDLVDERDRLIEDQLFRAGVLHPAAIRPAESKGADTVPTVYRAKLKFYRHRTDRIDVFIL